MKLKRDVVVVPDYSHSERDVRDVCCNKCKHKQKIEVYTDIPNYKFRCERCLHVQFLNQ